MSYDVMVFDPGAPPSDREGFMGWYREQTQWGEGHTYNDPAVSTSELRAWFFDMIREYPPMNGPHASDDVDDPKQTDYSIGRCVIYACFAWSQAEAASKTTFNLAEKHRVGFFDVSTNNGSVWMPNESGGYSCVHGQGAPKKFK
jgi:hypothetical protein